LTGTTSFKKWQKKDVVVIDVGGGSVEFVHGRAGKIIQCKSLPLGCVRVRDSLLSRQPADAESLAGALGILHEKMSRGFAKFIGLDCFLLGSGGTMVTLAALQRPGRGAVDLQHLEGLALSKTGVESRLNRLARSTLQELQANPRIPPRRAEVLTAGCCVFYAALLALDAPSIHCTTRGLRYGVWQKMLAPKPYHTVRHPN